MATRQPRTAKLASIEEPGRYFHPLLATLTTGAARLMLALAETLAEDEGLSWAFCDTDSHGPGLPAGDAPKPSSPSVSSGCEAGLSQLNPYRSGDELFKLEDAELRPRRPRRAGALLYASRSPTSATCCSTSAADGQPVLRKASAHGLGYLQAPYPAEKAPAEIPAPRVPLSRAWRRTLAV